MFWITFYIIAMWWYSEIRGREWGWPSGAMMSFKASMHVLIYPIWRIYKCISALLILNLHQKAAALTLTFYNLSELQFSKRPYYNCYSFCKQWLCCPLKMNDLPIIQIAMCCSNKHFCCRNKQRFAITGWFFATWDQTNQSNTENVTVWLKRLWMS